MVGAAAVATGLAAAAVIKQMKETLEYQAIQYVLLEMPELKAFELKHFGWEVKKWSDLSDTTNVPFLVSPEGEDPFVLLMVTSKGWVHQSGFYTDRVHFEKLDRSRWNTLMSAFLSSAGIVNVENAEAIPAFVRNPGRSMTRELEAQNRPVVEFDKHRYGHKHTLSVSEIDEFTGAGLWFYVGMDRVVFPFEKLKDDEYRINDVDENVRVVFNEKAMGIFYKHTRDLVQLKPHMVVKISRAVLPQVATKNAADTEDEY